MKRIAVIGAGRIGRPITANLVAAGYHVVVFDIEPSVAADVEQLGAELAQGGDDAAAGADVLLTVLPGSPELADVMLGSNGPGLLANLGPTTTWIDLTSAAPLLGRDLQDRAQRIGVPYLDAPTGGGPAAARSGQLAFYVGGETELVEQCRPLLNAIGAAEQIHHVGRAGAGYLTKLLINSMWFTQVLSLTETLLLAGTSGIDLSRLAAILPTSPAASALIDDYLPRLRNGDYVADFGLDRCVEELDSLVAWAERQSSPYDLSGEAARLHREALAYFGPVNGELLGAAYLEHRAGRRVG
jgi:3-hydroxyisobutyrate dehydrogenase